ncbi:CRISPR-associated protein Cas4 [Heliorestis acidaminivorans]|uniref:CRISPR-associated protein Cas4 n=1 Tax=Heliorestis acidaminivorans TaxID=553427 RepID=UPI001FAAF2CF|nr:CRISPR-associated protein Cas4 [Heliorestis acidaminivorans]
MEQKIILKVTDIKQYVYCPRIPYFTYVLPVPKKISKKMDYGKEAHERLDKLEQRRNFMAYKDEELQSRQGSTNMPQGLKKFHTYIYSRRLGLEGKLDLHLLQGTDIFPVEVKSTRRKPGLNHKYQLTAYAMLLEEHYNRPIRKGFFKILDPFQGKEKGFPKEKTIPVEITTYMRDYVKETMK